MDTERGDGSSDVELTLGLVTAHETPGAQLAAAEAIRHALGLHVARIIEENPEHFTDD